MEVVVVPIAVAVIGGPLMWMLRRFDRRNTVQHEGNMNVLDRIEHKMDKLDDRIHHHITWHAHDNKDQ